MTRASVAYVPPERDMLAVMRYVGGNIDSSVVDVLHEFGRVAADVLAPTDAVGDTHGARLVPDGSVRVAPEVEKAYRAYVDAGWPTVRHSPDLGGGGLGALVGAAIDEMFGSANLALSLNPLLTQGAIALIQRWGTSDQRDRYLGPLVSGEWSGTMAMTEPDAGSDVGALRTRAQPLGDGRWRIDGTKIFITWGEHDLTSNIIHLVLARTPGAAPGVRGISLFAVPKWLPSGARNSVRCIAVEHKLGIHASPTCVLELDGAQGELVGAEHAGMPAMFTMMNAARLAIGLQGLSIGERCTQQSWGFARIRLQGAAPGAPQGVSSPIIEHPDVVRMLLDLRSSTRAMRLLLYRTAALADAASSADTDEARVAGIGQQVDLLTPVAKAWCTDTGVRLASIAIQVHGGMGYIEETGVAQRLRDSRIGPIYEGTNGVQAIDFVMRKVRRGQGHCIGEHLRHLQGQITDLVDFAPIHDVVSILEEALESAYIATDWVLTRSDDDRTHLLAGATSYLELVAVTTVAISLAHFARHLSQQRTTREELAEACTDARFFAAEHAVLVPGLRARVMAGATRITEVVL